MNFFRLRRKREENTFNFRFAFRSPALGVIMIMESRKREQKASSRVGSERGRACEEGEEREILFFSQKLHVQSSAWSEVCSACCCCSQSTMAYPALLRLTCWISTRNWCLSVCSPPRNVSALSRHDLHCTFELVQGGKLAQLLWKLEHWGREEKERKKNNSKCNHAENHFVQINFCSSRCLHWISKSAWLLSPSPSELLAMHVYWPIWERRTLVITKLWFEIITPLLFMLFRSIACRMEAGKMMKSRPRIDSTNFTHVLLPVHFVHPRISFDVALKVDVGAFFDTRAVALLISAKLQCQDGNI